MALVCKIDVVGGRGLRVTTAGVTMIHLRCIIDKYTNGSSALDGALNPERWHDVAATISARGRFFSVKDITAPNWFGKFYSLVLCTKHQKRTF